MKYTRDAGLMPYIFPAILALVALHVVMSGRDLTQAFLTLSNTESDRGVIVTWAQRAVSLLVVAATVEQVLAHVRQDRALPSAALLLAFIGYWTATVGTPMLFAANPVISHEYMYSLALGVAACLAVEIERERMMRLARNGLFLMMLAGLALVPFKLTLVMDPSYNQGLIPGLPRFAGLTAHAVTQGTLAMVALLLLWCHPYARRWLNRMAWLLGLSVLFLAQSKATWGAFLVAASLLVLVRHGADLVRRTTDPRDNTFGVLALCGLIIAAIGFGAWALVANGFDRMAEFADGREAAQMMTMTGRDRIWAAAWEEWSYNPIFGYGLSIWDPVYRVSIGMPEATHAHNQFLDDLSRSGSIGGAATVVYALVLLALSIRTARASGGLSLALFSVIAIRSIAEVPLSLLTYGTELFAHLLLLATVAAASAQSQPRDRRAPMRFGVTS
jgi:O-antigen ligase